MRVNYFNYFIISKMHLLYLGRSKNLTKQKVIFHVPIIVLQTLFFLYFKYLFRQIKTFYYYYYFKFKLLKCIEINISILLTNN